MRLLDTSQAAEFLRLKRSTLETWRSAMCGPSYVKVGRRVLYREADLERWLTSRRVEPMNDKRHPKVATAAGSVSADPSVRFTQEQPHEVERREA
jgi:predicted DNA-binding transcriptional regulator AlpA